MQQFVRRTDPGASPESSDQVSGDLASLAAQVAELVAEVQSLKKEVSNVSTGHQTPVTPEHLVSEDPSNEMELSVLEEEVTEPVARQDVEQSPTSTSGAEGISEELLVDLVRSTGVSESVQTSPKPEGSHSPGIAMSDEEIQRLLEEASRGSDATNETSDDEQIETSSISPVSNDSIEFEAEDGGRAGLPVVGLSIELDREVLDKVPAKLAIAALAIPHRFEEGKLVCKSVQPYDLPALDLLSEAAGCELEVEPVSIEQAIAALRLAYGPESEQAQKDAVWDVSGGHPGQKLGLFKRSA